MQRRMLARTRLGDDGPLLQRLQAMRIERSRRMVAAATSMPVREREEGGSSSGGKAAKKSKGKTRVVHDDDSSSDEEEQSRGNEEIVFSGNQDRPATLTNAEDDDEVKLLVLGFDGTLTMGGYFDPEAKKMKHMSARDEDAEAFMHAEDFEHVLNFGGINQIRALVKLFETLQDEEFGVELRILSLGQKRAIMHGLEEVGLLKFFSDDEAGTDGARIWGEDTPPFDGDSTYKALVLQDWMDELQLGPNEVVFVDDDPFNIKLPGRNAKYGAANILARGHAIEHPAAYSFVDKHTPGGSTLRRVEELCGLVDLDAEGEDAEA